VVVVVVVVVVIMTPCHLLPSSPIAFPSYHGGSSVSVAVQSERSHSATTRLWPCLYDAAWMMVVVVVVLSPSMVEGELALVASSV